MKHARINVVDIGDPGTWQKYRKGLCDTCVGSCCSLPVEATLSDLVRMELVDAFEADGAITAVAKRLKRDGSVEHFSAKSGKFTLARRASGDCFYLDQQTRRCTIYAQRPNVCRKHPQVGPRPGYCAYIEK